MAGSMRTLARWLLGSTMVLAGLSHLFWAREQFQVAVPDWAEVGGLDKDAIVVASGAAEVALGAALVALPRERRRVGWALATFFVAVFPGNLDMYLNKRGALGMDTDTKLLVRLFFQPVLVAWALWATAPDES